MAIGIGRLFALAFLVSGFWLGSFNLLLVGGFLLFATYAEARRVRQFRAQIHRVHRSYPYVPRWRLHPRP